MLELLQEVEDCKYDAVLVMDVDRLGSGNMREQGLILETFKEYSTKLITQNKTYNLQNEFDEESSEFEIIIARRELKIIKKRLMIGRMKSLEEGNYYDKFSNKTSTFQDINDRRIYEGNHEESLEKVQEIADAIQPHFPGNEKDILVTLINRYKDQDTWRPNPIITEEGLEHMMDIIELLKT